MEKGINNVDIIYSKTLIAGAWMYPRQQHMLNHIKTKINSYICLEFNSKQKVEFNQKKGKINGVIDYMTCNDKMCIPYNWSFEIKLSHPN